MLTSAVEENGLAVKSDNQFVDTSKISMKVFSGILISVFLIFGSKAMAQQSRGTTKGTVQITGEWNDSTLVAVSKDLLILLNYETANFELRLDKSTLRTGIDSLDQKLKELEGDVLVYEGKLGIGFVQTQSHSPQDFRVEGYLTCDSHNVPIVGKGHLDHVFGDLYPCLLNMTFHLNLKEIDLDVGLPGLSDEVHVEIVQALLKRENE